MIGVYLVILWLASAYWAFRDMQQRSDNAFLPYLAAAGIILFTPIFFIFAVWIYKIVRPHERIGEVWERNLAEEALLAEVEAIHHCPTCERRIDDEWIICPTCRTRLNRVCPNCSRLVGMDWSLCAWCGKDFERRELPAAMEALPGGRDVTGQVVAVGLGQQPDRTQGSHTDHARVVPLQVRGDPGTRAGSAARTLTPADPPIEPGPEEGIGRPGGMGRPARSRRPAVPADPPPPAGPDRPGASTFTIEGRSAPALFVVGWLATLLGLGLHRRRRPER